MPSGASASGGLFLLGTPHYANPNRCTREKIPLNAQLCKREYFNIVEIHFFQKKISAERPEIIGA